MIYMVKGNIHTQTGKNTVRNIYGLKDGIRNTAGFLFFELNVYNE